MECAPPLYFDPDLGVCNWPRFVDCQQASTTAEASTEAPVTTTADTTTPEATNTTTAEVVDTTTPEAVDPTTAQAAPSTTEEVVDTTTDQPTSSDDARRFRRSVNMAADKTSTEADETTEPVKTTTAESTTAVFDAVCPEEIFLSFVPHPDCNKYYECAWGVPILMSCPPTLYFDPKLNICNYPDQVDCQMPSTTE